MTKFYGLVRFKNFEARIEYVSTLQHSEKKYGKFFSGNRKNSLSQKLAIIKDFFVTRIENSVLVTDISIQ